MNTLVLAPFSESGIVALAKYGTVVHESWTETLYLYDPEELGQRLVRERFEALVVEADFLYEELFIAAAGVLKMAAICRGNLNQVDLDSATTHKVGVLHTPGRNAQAVAEFTLGLVLSLARSIPYAQAYLYGGHWEDPTEGYRMFQGREIMGATLGVIGLGQIGTRVVRMGKRLGMRALAHDPFVDSSSQGVAGLHFVSLEELLKESDFVTIHIPGTVSNEALLDAAHLKLMQPTAYLVNVTSTTVVDTEALAVALRTGRLAGAAMDVHETHPIAPSSPFFGLPNVILTPHIGGATIETVHRQSIAVVNGFSRFLKQKRPRNLANPEVWNRRVGTPND